MIDGSIINRNDTPTSTKIWAGVVIVGILVLAMLAISGNGKSEAAKRAARAAEAGTRIVQQNTARTECIREISNELDHAHWTLIGQAFNATTRDELHRIGQQLSDLPLTQDIANQGGVVLRQRFAKCPPVPNTPPG